LNRSTALNKKQINGTTANQLELDKLIKDISQDPAIDKNQTEEDYIKRFKSIYSDTSFRHSYSSLTRIVLDCYDKQDNLFTLLGNFQHLQDYINECYSNKTDSHFIKSFFKLFDHIQLESSRLRFIDNIKNTYQKQLDKSNHTLKLYEEKFNNLKSEYQKNNRDFETKLRDYDKKIMEQFSKATSQSITILGIFSAIVFAFTGGFSFIGNAFDNGINSPYPLRYIFSILLLSFSLFNILLGLISTLFKLSIGKTLAWSCRFATSCDSQNEKCKKCCLLLRIFRKYPLASIVNTILIIGMVIVFVGRL
jgi:hypothetical protein